MSFWERLGLLAAANPGNGIEWIVSKPAGLEPAELIKAQLGMLEECDIAAFVPLRLEAADGAMSLRYRVEGLRPLSAAARDGTLTGGKAEGVLVALASALKEGERYLIDPSDVVLHPDWVWVCRDDVRNVRLFAVPLRSYASPGEAWRQWKAMYETLCRNGLPERWVASMSPARWEEETFSHRLWMAEIDKEWGEASSKSGDATAAPDVEAPPVSNGSPDLRDGKGAGFLPRGPRPAEERDAFKAIEEMPGDGETVHFSFRSVRSGELLWLAVALLCWVCFAIKPWLPLLALAIVGSLPLGLALWKKYRAETEAPAGGFEREPATSIPYAEPVEASIPLAERTVLLNGADKTVLLGKAAAEHIAARAKLVVRFDGSDRIEIAALDDLPLKIGRGPAHVGVVVDHAAASRWHLTIDRKEDGYYAVDVGSMNGSFYNDAPMSPNERYALRHGDLLRLPGASLTFELEDGRGGVSAPLRRE